MGAISGNLPCAGVKEALQSMRNKEESFFLMSPEYCYGSLGLQKQGTAVDVPKNAWLLWKVSKVYYLFLFFFVSTYLFLD